MVNWGCQQNYCHVDNLFFFKDERSQSTKKKGDAKERPGHPILTRPCTPFQMPVFNERWTYDRQQDNSLAQSLKCHYVTNASVEVTFSGHQYRIKDWKSLYLSDGWSSSMYELYGRLQSGSWVGNLPVGFTGTQIQSIWKLLTHQLQIKSLATGREVSCREVCQ